MDQYGRRQPLMHKGKPRDGHQAGSKTRGEEKRTMKINEEDEKKKKIVIDVVTPVLSF